MTILGKTMRALAAAAGMVTAGGAALAQDMGGLARFDAAASHVRAAGAGVEIVLELSQGVPWRVFTLDAPPRLVLDFREVDWGAAEAAALLETDRVGALRFGTFRPGWSRLVAELAGPMTLDRAGLRPAPDGSGATLGVVLSPSDPESFAARAGAPRDPRWDLPEPAAVAPERAPRGGRLRVMLDPGHGGLDPGAEVADGTEADLMLTFARELKEVLLRTGGFEVAMTREADVFVSLEARVAAAHEAGADVFVSLHADALEEGVARGAAVYVLAEEASDAASAALAERHEREDLLAGIDLSDADDGVASVLMDLARLDNAPRSRALAAHLLDGIRGATAPVHKRPLRHADFSVLKAADIPSVLVELGFLSTQADLENLRDPDWRARMAAGLRDGLRAWAAEDAALAGLRRR
ncbi:N-acetylmuramoyl-L-alanine amidase [Roseivivax sp. CAU 1761]